MSNRTSHQQSKTVHMDGLWAESLKKKSISCLNKWISKVRVLGQHWKHGPEYSLKETKWLQ